MGRYRKIEVATWGDSKFQALSAPLPNAQSLWFYLLTGPHTNSIPGLFVIGKAALAEALKWDENDDLLEGFRKAFDELHTAKMVRFDPKTRLVWIPNALKYNLPESPNVIRSWKAQIRELPETELLGIALSSIRSTIYGMGEGFQKAFVEAFGKDMPKGYRQPSPNQEQEHEQDPEEFADSPKANPDVSPVDIVDNSAPSEADFSPEPTTEDFQVPASLVIPKPLKFTDDEAAELSSQTGEHAQAHLARLALIRVGKDYGFKNDWALLRWFWDKAGGPSEWLAGEKPDTPTGLRAEAAKPAKSGTTPDEMKSGVTINMTAKDFVTEARAAKAQQG